MFRIPSCLAQAVLDSSFGCDSKPMRPIDLVMDVHAMDSPADAAIWIAERFSVPSIPARKHFTVLLVVRMPTDAEWSPFWWRSGCQQCILPVSPKRRSNALRRSPKLTPPYSPKLTQPF